jgi:transposase
MATLKKSTTSTVEGPDSDTRRRFDPTFKLEAVSLGKRIGISQAAKDLGVGEPNLRNWTQAVAAHGAQAFAPLSQRTDVDAEMRRLREENRVLKIEREILKKRQHTLRGKTGEVRFHFRACR